MALKANVNETRSANDVCIFNNTILPLTFHIDVALYIYTATTFSLKKKLLTDRYIQT